MIYDAIIIAGLNSFYDLNKGCSGDSNKLLNFYLEFRKFVYISLFNVQHNLPYEKVA